MLKFVKIWKILYNYFSSMLEFSVKMCEIWEAAWKEKIWLTFSKKETLHE